MSWLSKPVRFLATSKAATDAYREREPYWLDGRPAVGPAVLDIPYFKFRLHGLSRIVGVASLCLGRGTCFLIMISLT